MFRNFGSAFKHRFVTSRLVGTALVAAVVASFAAVGCSSSSDTSTPDAGPTNCNLDQVEALFTAKNCTTGGCHDSTGFAAGLNLTATGLATRLVGKGPDATAGVTHSVCTGGSQVYLVAGSNPATGLLIDKVKAGYSGCGTRMPMGGLALTASEFSCIQTWATSVTSP
jgi:hypothetical protein